MTLDSAWSWFSAMSCSSSSSICTRVSLRGCVHCSAPRLPPMAARIFDSAAPSLLKVSGAPCAHRHGLNWAVLWSGGLVTCVYVGVLLAKKVISPAVGTLGSLCQTAVNFTGFRV